VLENFINYDGILKIWAGNLFPDRPFFVKVLRVEELRTDEPGEAQLVFAVRVNLKNGEPRDFLVIIKKDKVDSWINMTFNDADEEEDEGEDVFTYRDQA
jgi:hypothetical protein